MMLEINRNISIADEYIQIRFVRSSGPGGQNVNKVNTRAQLDFNLADCPDLNEAVKKRFARLAGTRMTGEGHCVMESDRHRSQKQNRDEVLQRLRAMIRQALTPPKKRRPTKPTAASKRKRLEDKKHRGKIKEKRRPIRRDDL